MAADATKFPINALDRAIMAFAPKWGLSRVMARLAVRHYEAASMGRRTTNWQRRLTDAHSAAGGSLATLRAHSRDLIRNNGWARNARRTVNRNVVGYGITPKAVGAVPEKVREAWKRWAGTTQCDAAGRLTFSGLQKLAMNTVFESGEVLVRRRWRRPSDDLAIPMQLQVLEPDFLDTSKNGIRGEQGGPIIYGIEFDAIGRRVAYWLFDSHPGSVFLASPVSRRIPASEIIHSYDVERAGQDRGVPWLVAAILKLKDFDEFEDAQLMRQKIAACFVGLITDPQGEATSGMGEADVSTPGIETMEPGTMLTAPPGKDVKFGNPPLVTDDGFSVRTLRGAAAAIGVTYEDLTGDYSQVNFSSARMSRLAHWGNVYDWQWNMLIPQFCDPTWRWAMEAAAFAGLVSATELPAAEWTPMPMPMTDPDKEARANVIRLRSGQATLPQVLREQGLDPDAHLAEIAAANKKLDQLGIWLDSDPRRTSAAGLTQERAGAAGGSAKEDGAGSGAAAPPDAAADE
jgi:lambda family phage portal protein